MKSLNDYLILKSKAISLAKEKHHHQSYGPYPYIVHLNHVYQTAKRLGVNPLISLEQQEILLASILHDIIEDTDYSVDELKEEFGEAVASLVLSVSLPNDLKREDAYKVVYKNILKNPNSAVVKVADRIANLEASLYEFPNKLKKYLSERDEFDEVIYKALGHTLFLSKAQKELTYLYVLIENKF